MNWGTAATTVLHNTPTLVQDRDNVAITASPRRFFRLKAIGGPVP